MIRGFAFPGRKILQACLGVRESRGARESRGGAVAAWWTPGRSRAWPWLASKAYPRGPGRWSGGVSGCSPAMVAEGGGTPLV